MGNMKCRVEVEADTWSHCKCECAWLLLDAAIWFDCAGLQLPVCVCVSSWTLCM